jgi:hypothetical protein
LSLFNFGITGVQFAILKILSGNSAGRKAVIRPGQLLRVGRAFDADLSIPEDTELAEQHFIFDGTQSGCRIRCHPGCELAFGEEKSSDRLVFNGDQFRAGGTDFGISIEGELASNVSDTPVPEQNAELEDTTPLAPPPACDLSSRAAAEVVAQYSAKDVVLAMLQPEMNCLDLLAALADREEFDASVQLLAFALPKQHAVWWAIDCIEQSAGESLSPQDLAALESARAWVLDPSEEHRRAAETHAMLISMGSAAGAAAMAAFWSGGSLSSPEFEAVPPPDHLTAQAVYAALCMTCIEGDGRDQNLSRFHESGLKIAAGENLWG